MKFVFSLMALCLLAVTAFAQISTGSLVGTVVDQNGGSVAGATVEVTDTATGKLRTVQASTDGTFTVPQVDVGTYTVKITAQGFKTYTATEVKIDVGRPYSLAVTLEPGIVTENVTVVAGADVLNATNAELSNTVSSRQIQELPLNGRNPLVLLTLQPGSASNGATNTAINGQRTSFTNITRDGINIQDNFIRANATDFSPQRPGVDDISQFTVTTSNADAALGYGASQVNIATERGQSEFHGSLFEYNRNSKFSSRPFFSNQRAFLNRNQFGFRVGGPSPLPRFGEGGLSTYKNKAFFFFNYEGFRQRQTTSALKTILTPQARNGVFSYNAACTNAPTNPCPAGVSPPVNCSRSTCLPSLVQRSTSMESIQWCKAAFWTKFRSQEIRPTPATSATRLDSESTWRITLIATTSPAASTSSRIRGTRSTLSMPTAMRTTTVPTSPVVILWRH